MVVQLIVIKKNSTKLFTMRPSLLSNERTFGLVLHLTLLKLFRRRLVITVQGIVGWASSGFRSRPARKDVRMIRRWSGRLRDFSQNTTPWYRW